MKLLSEFFFEHGERLTERVVFGAVKDRVFNDVGDPAVIVGLRVKEDSENFIFILACELKQFGSGAVMTVDTGLGLPFLYALFGFQFKTAKVPGSALKLGLFLPCLFLPFFLSAHRIMASLHCIFQAYYSKGHCVDRSPASCQADVGLSK